MSILYIVATPLGNLADISLRALTVLKNVDMIAAEDTRHTEKLKAHYAIGTPVISYHTHNEEASAKGIIKLLQEGKSVAVVSDAGTPVISDPGYLIVKYAHAAHLRVVPVPGACAAIAGLSASGLPSHRFIFEGFLPVKSDARCARLKILSEETRTLIFYEAPHRIIAMLKDAQAILGEREAVVARELTKAFETIQKKSLSEWGVFFLNNSQSLKGEFVVIIAGASLSDIACKQQIKSENLLKQLLSYLPLKRAVLIASETFGVPKNALYTKALAWKEKN